MNNEPVGWMRESDKAVCSNEEKLWFIEEEGSDWNYVIPLYTHPGEHDLGIAEAIGFEKGHKSAADMLREQQAEIETLKERNKELESFYRNVKARMDI